MDQENIPHPMQQDQSPTTSGETGKVHRFALLIALAPLIAVCFKIPGLNFVFPLILWILWRDCSPQVYKVGKNVVNSQLSWFIWFLLLGINYTAVAFTLSVIHDAHFIFAFFNVFRVPTLGAFIMVAISTMVVCWIVFTVMHFIKVYRGNDDYVMPLTMRLFK